MYKYKIILLMVLASLLLFLSACERTKTVCTPEESTSQTTLLLTDLIKATPPQASSSTPIQVKIQGKVMEVDKVVDYPLCNDEWSGTVYVNCEAQVAQAKMDADANPLFLKGCNLNIAPNTVVYVAAHNDAPYYKGCSCHTGEDPIP